MKVRISKPVFYILSCSWGILYTATGLMAAAVLVLTGHKPKRWGWVWYFEIGRSAWGGMEWGPFFIKDRMANDRLKDHEFGHAIQNCLYGPFMVFLVSLPSTVRYWYRRIRTAQGKKPASAYEDIWFEAQATRFGTETMRRIRMMQETTH